LSHYLKVGLHSNSDYFCWRKGQGVDVQVKLLLLIVGIGNGLFLAFTLRRIGQSGRSSTRYLGYLLLAFTLLLVIELLDVTVSWLIVPLPIGLLIGPLTYLYIRSTIHNSSQYGDRDILHFLPSLTAFVVFFGLYLQNMDNWHFEVLMAFVGPSAVLQRVSLLAYPTAAFILLLKSRSIIRREHIADANVLMLWLSLFLGAVLSLMILSIPTVRTLVGDFEQDMMGAIVVVVLVHTLGYMVIARRSLQDGFAKPRTTSLNDDEIQHISKKIKAWLKLEKQYLDPDISLDTMSQSLDLPRNKVSDILNVGLGGNFYYVINSYRIEAFKHLAKLPENSKKSVLELAFACGFNSKAAFYRAFKTLEGMTPTQYRQDSD
jgi:AraC-like DNA-binding protein